MSRRMIARDFGKAIATGNAAVFVGAGISKSAGYPDWAELVGKIASRLDLPSGPDLVSLVQFATNQSRNRALINEILIDQFNRDRPIPPTLSILAELPIRTFWTTNYDRLLERALEAAGKKIDVKIRHTDLARTLPGRDVTLHKMHGDVMSPGEAVLSRDDYESYENTRRLFTDCLTVDLLDKTFLFLGVGFTDPNLNRIFARLNTIFGAGQKRHYWIVRSSQRDERLAHWDRLRAEDLQRYGIHAITVNEYDEIPKFLEEVAEQCAHERCAKTVFFSGSVEDDNPDAELVRETATQLSTMLCEAGFRLATGLGAGLGDYTVAAAFDHLAKPGRAPRLDQLTIHTYPLGARLAKSESARAELVASSRRKVIESAAFVVILCGRQRERKLSGVWQEYRIARELGRFVIPIGATGGMASTIREDLRKNSDPRMGSLPPRVQEDLVALNKKGTQPRELAERALSVIQHLRDLG